LRDCQPKFKKWCAFQQFYRVYPIQYLKFNFQSGYKRRPLIWSIIGSKNYSALLYNPKLHLKEYHSQIRNKYLQSKNNKQTTRIISARFQQKIKVFIK
jgi:hypothetical protein